MSDLAIIRTGGKQYIVSPASRLKIEKIPGAEGEEVVLGEVLLVSGGNKLKIGAPLVAGHVVKARITKQARDVKKLVFRYHSKTRYQKKRGHRQHYTEIEIVSI